MSVIDIRSAFRLFKIRGTNIPLVGFVSKGQAYFERALPSGLRSNPELFERLGVTLDFIFPATKLDTNRFVDDFIATYLPAIGACDAAKLQALFALVKVPVAFEKSAIDVTRLKYIGVLLDMIARTVGLSDLKRKAYSELLHNWLTKRAATARKVVPLGGRLIWLCAIFPQACPYTPRILWRLRNNPQPHKYVRIAAAV
ncbi:hypothetical protein SARC_02480 [Sphaeroforma arctica JP610]|uniref:Uncharacterized protein n=1 Tax=Sphaeroforma arctica JP610 TaxID=667725 RepID=A0A0L0GAP7_9EUKA|nr:hypothetical protein SARC_02480 [Sphaeroforma arctica JP610]KNC85333.1 hypothetical protein SARC_02480 [Sphaeroforma arctica JP610]|eukprot:XP_014159235.1 hypothetical protein SARC_02480 [Sphaeroforma arctica JP610]